MISPAGTLAKLVRIAATCASAQLMLLLCFCFWGEKRLSCYCVGGSEVAVWQNGKFQEARFNNFYSMALNATLSRCRV